MIILKKAVGLTWEVDRTLFSGPYHKKKKNELVVSDYSIESKIVLTTINNFRITSGCYDYIMKKYKKDKDDIFRKRIIFIENDFFLNPNFTNKKFDNISQIGLFGLCKNKNEYFESLCNAMDLLEKSGILIGANWIFSNDYANRKGFKNEYITEKFLKESFSKLQVQCKLLKYHEIIDDVNYKGVIIYVVNK